MPWKIAYGFVGVISASGKAITDPPVLALITTLYSWAKYFGAWFGPDEAVSIPSKVTIHTKPMSAKLGSIGIPCLAACCRFRSCSNPSILETRVAAFKPGSSSKAALTACALGIAPFARGSETGIGIKSKPRYSKFCGVAAKSCDGSFTTVEAWVEVMCQIKKPIPPTIKMTRRIPDMMTPTFRLLILFSFFFLRLLYLASFSSIIHFPNNE